MKLLFKGPVIITGGSSQLGMALARALREEGAKTLSVCRSSEGLARCGEAGLSCLPLDEPESLPERCRGLLGEPPAHLVDLMHSRFESLIAGAAPEAIMEWAAVDIGLRARLVRAAGHRGGLPARAVRPFGNRPLLRRGFPPFPRRDARVCQSPRAQPEPRAIGSVPPL